MSYNNCLISHRNDNFLLSCQWFCGLFKPVEDFEVPPFPDCTSCCLHDSRTGPHGSCAASRETGSSVPTRVCSSWGQGGDRSARGRGWEGPPVFLTVKPGLGVGCGAARCDREQGHPPASPITLGAWPSMVCCWCLAECELKMV